MSAASTDKNELILRMCGPSQKDCDHDWSEREQLIADGGAYGESLRCAKCKALAIDMDMWS
jgi:hypothetical protein